MARIHDSDEPLLRRPLGILNCENDSIWLYFQVRGRGTLALSQRHPGEEIDLLGPLGNGFPPFSGKSILLIAGGRGIVPLFFYLRTHAAENNLLLAYGARSRSDLTFIDELKPWPLRQTFFYTEDGSFSRKGRVTDNLIDIIISEKVDATISCGPDAMLHRLSQILPDTPLGHFVSLEALMGCGFGICHSCAVMTSSGEYQKVCEDGPVFPITDIAWPN